MNSLSIQNVAEVVVKRNKHSSFETLTLMVKDDKDAWFEVTLFSDAKHHVNCDVPYDYDHSKQPKNAAF